jgi:hypothetical protein
LAAVDLVDEPLSRLVVIDLIDLGGALVAIEPIEHLRTAGSPSPSAPAMPAICTTGASRRHCSLA